MAVGQMLTLVLSNISVLPILYLVWYMEVSLQSYCVIQELKLLLTYGARIGLVEKCKVTLEGR